MMAEGKFEFVYHDGAYIHMTKLIEMAKKAGSYNLAEHYIVSLLVHANRYQLLNIIDEVDNIRKHYNLAPFPTAGAPASSNNMPNFESPQEKQAEIARGYYIHLTKDRREALLKEALAKMLLEKDNLFTKKACWIGVYLVVKGRLDEDLKMQVFCTYDITPKGWPSRLAIGQKALSNFGRYIKGKDQLKPYYLMEKNPFKDLCTKFWEILLGLILTKNSSKK